MIEMSTNTPIILQYTLPLKRQEKTQQPNFVVWNSVFMI